MIICSVFFITTSSFALWGNAFLLKNIVPSIPTYGELTILPIMTTGALIESNSIFPIQFDIDEVKLKKMNAQDAQKYIQEKMDSYNKSHFGSWIQTITVTSSAASMTGIVSVSSWILVHEISTASPFMYWNIVAVSQIQWVWSWIILSSIGDVWTNNKSIKRIKKRAYNSSVK